MVVNGTLLGPETIPGTIYLRQSSPRQVVQNTGSAAHQQEIREVFRLAAEGKTCAEIAEELNKRGHKTARRRNRR